MNPERDDVQGWPYVAKRMDARERRLKNRHRQKKSPLPVQIRGFGVKAWQLPRPIEDCLTCRRQVGYP